MNALTVLSVIALAACSSSQIIGYPGILGYSGLISGASPITLKTLGTTSPVALNTISPVTYASAPLAYNTLPVAPVAPIQTQYHSQDEVGQYAFGYAGGPASRAESRDVFGIVRGSYNYVDGDGQIQTQHYVADGLGFRVSGTNLPVAPEAPEATPLDAPLPVDYTPEVAAARAAHLAAHSEAATPTAVEALAEPAAEPTAEPAAELARKKRAVVAAPAVSAISPLRFSYGFSAPLTLGHQAVIGSPLTYSLPTIGAAPLQYTTAVGGVPTIASLPAATPITYAAGVPAVTAYSTAAAASPREATLLRVVNNPNHAVSYRVD